MCVINSLYTDISPPFCSHFTFLSLGSRLHLTHEIQPRNNKSILYPFSANMRLTPDLHRSPITGKMIHLPYAASEPPPVQKPKPKPESKSSSNWHPSSPPYYALMPPPTQMMKNPVFQSFNGGTFNGGTFNFNNGSSARSGQRPSHNGHSSNYGQHFTQNKPSSGYSHHSTSIPNNHSPKSENLASHHRTWVPPTTATTHRSSPQSNALVPRTTNNPVTAYNKPCHCPSCKEKKRVHFTESVSAREREREQKKQWHPNGGHRTNYESKSGRKPQAVKVERLMCERCRVRGQEWRVDGKMVCEGCFRYGEGKKAGRG